MHPFNVPAAELEKVHAETLKRFAESQKLYAEIQKINAQTCKMACENFWYPVAIAIGMFGTVATITALIIKLL
ncbi:MAG: hypothetical protein ACOH2R_05665 [Pseudomonas sp.]